jgi:hypothetical protein
MGEDGLHGEGILRGGDAPQAATTVGVRLTRGPTQSGHSAPEPFPCAICLIDTPPSEGATLRHWSDRPAFVGRQRCP